LKVDVIVLTKNSLKPCLKETLESVEAEARKANVNIRLIVIDKSSEDGTRELVKNWLSLRPILIDDPQGNRATARQLGIESVETEFFVFLDSDVILNDGWFVDALGYFKDRKVGAVWGLTLPIEESELEYKKAMSKIYNRPVDEIMFSHADIRGLTHDTMIRKEAVKGIKIPPELHVMEDHYIRRHVEKLGYKWLNVERPSCLHHRHPRTFEGAYLDAYYGYKLGVYSKKWLVRHASLFPFKLVYLALATLNWDILKTETVKELAFLKAFFRIVVEGSKSLFSNNGLS
jgi:glycosyltransferase involved in cell wall biosynthesis